MLKTIFLASRKWWSSWTKRRFIALVVIPSLCGALLAHGIALGDLGIMLGALSLIGWHLYLVLPESA